MDKDYRERVREEAAEEVVPRICVNPEGGGEAGTHRRRRIEKELRITERPKRAKKKVGEYVEKRMEEGKDASGKRRNNEENAKEQPMNDQTPVFHQDAARSAVGEAEKRKRDGEDDDGEEERVRAQGSKEEAGPSEVGKGGGSRKCGAEDEESEEKMAKYLRKLAREAKRKKTRRKARRRM